MCAQRRRTNRGRPPQPAPKTLPEDLYDYNDDPQPSDGPQRATMPLLGPDGQRMRVTDDWPEDVPVTEAEIDVFERWFGDVFDDLLSPKRPKDSLPILSSSDRKEA